MPSRFGPSAGWQSRSRIPVPTSRSAAVPRLCIGERFAMLEGVLVLATLARRWQVTTLDSHTRIDARFTLRPRGGLRARIRAA